MRSKLKIVTAIVVAILVISTGFFVFLKNYNKDNVYLVDISPKGYRAEIVWYRSGLVFVHSDLVITNNSQDILCRIELLKFQDSVGDVKVKIKNIEWITPDELKINVSAGYHKGKPEHRQERTSIKISNERVCEII